MATPWTIPAAQKPKIADTTIPDFFGTAGSDAPTVVIRQPKVPGADPAIYQQFQDVNRLHGVIDETTAPWLAAFAKATPGLSDANAQEMSDINSIYSPQGYQASFQGIRDRRAAALKNLDAQMLADMKRQLGLGRVGSGGQAGAGLNSFLARMAAAESGKLRAAEATDAAAQERSDTAALMAARSGATGKRQTLSDQLLARLLQPQQVAASGNQAFSTALQAAIQQFLMNSMLGVGVQTQTA